MDLHWSFIFFILLHQLNPVDAYYGFFERFCREYTRAAGPGQYSSYKSNVNDGETCVMKFNYAPPNNKTAHKLCGDLSPFVVTDASIQDKNLQCTYKSYVKCANEHDVIISGECYTIVPGGKTCSDSLGSIEDGMEMKWITLAYRKQHNIVLVGPGTAQYRQVSNPGKKTKNLALYLGAGERGKLVYVTDAQAADLPKFCVTPPLQSVGIVTNFCDKLKLFDIVTYYDTNMCYVASGSYYPLDSFVPANKRCQNLFGPMAQDAPTDSEYDFVAANLMLKQLRQQEGSWSSFGTRMYYNASRRRKDNETVHRNMDWQFEHQGNGAQLFQMEFPLKPEHRVSFHYAANNYSSLINQRPSKHVRQLCRIGPGASNFKPRDGVCEPKDRVYVSDKGTVKCIAPPPPGLKQLGNTSACPEYYEMTDFESEREYKFFYKWTQELGYHYVNINTQYNYGQVDNSYGMYIYMNGKQMIYNHIFDYDLNGNPRNPETCLHSGYLSSTFWNDNRCLTDLPYEVAYYCTKYVE